MSVGWETTEVNGSTMRIYVGAPDRPGPTPGILVAQHGAGVDNHVQDIVNRLHREGYIAAAPEIYHRQPPTLERAKRPQSVRDDELIADLNATIAHLKANHKAVSRLGVIGFCMGGRVAYLAATAISELKAAAVFYPGNVMKALGHDGPSPFARSSGIQCPVMCFFGVEDANPSPEDMKKMDDELTRLGKWHEFHAYQNTGHAFQDITRNERYRERAARASWEETLAFFADRLKRG